MSSSLSSSPPLMFLLEEELRFSWAATPRNRSEEVGLRWRKRLGSLRSREFDDFGGFFLDEIEKKKKKTKILRFGGILGEEVDDY